jgi:hypothetical protein
MYMYVIHVMYDIHAYVSLNKVHKTEHPHGGKNKASAHTMSCTLIVHVESKLYSKLISMRKIR